KCARPSGLVISVIASSRSSWLPETRKPSSTRSIVNGSAELGPRYTLSAGSGCGVGSPLRFSSMRHAAQSRSCTPSPVAADMAKELQAESRAFVSTFDQTGQVRHDEAGVVGELHHTEHRLQRRERIVGDLRPCGAGR